MGTGALENGTKGHSHYIMEMILSTFCLCPETLNEPDFKGDGLINLVEEISRQHGIQAVT
jgi:hypothetical protein